MNKNIIVVLALMIATVGGYWLVKTERSVSPRACTEEAKVCPDGSFVSRTGPNCEFAACPNAEIIFGQEAESICGPQSPATCTGETALGCATGNKKWDCYSVGSIDTSGWQTYRNEEYGFEVRYPSSWFLRQKSSMTILSNVPSSSAISEQSLAAESAFELSTHPNANPRKLPVGTWFEEYFAGGFAVEPNVKKIISVDGRDAILIEISEIGQNEHIYIPTETNVVEIAYGIYEPRFIPEYKAILNSFQFK